MTKNLGNARLTRVRLMEENNMISLATVKSCSRRRRKKYISEQSEKQRTSLVEFIWELIKKSSLNLNFQSFKLTDREMLKFLICYRLITDW